MNGFKQIKQMSGVGLGSGGCFNGNYILQIQ